MRSRKRMQTLCWPLYDRGVAVGAALAILPSPVSGAPSSWGGENDGGGNPSTTPIKHVVVIIGENHTFDNVFGTFQPPPGTERAQPAVRGHRERRWDAGPERCQGGAGPGHRDGVLQVTPTVTAAYPTVPQPNTTYVWSACDGGQGQNSPDTRFPSNLANAPYQITKYVPYDDPHTGSTGCEFNGAYVGDPIHRFYEMYQQVNGGKSNLFTWVHETSGDSNGNPPPSPFTDQSTDQGALDMGFYNMAQGDAPYFDSLAQHYAMSDNYHQAVMGGTGANHIMLGTGDAAYYQNQSGVAVRPADGRDREPQSAARNEQLLHAGRLRPVRHDTRRELLGLRRPIPARGRCS